VFPRGERAPSASSASDAAPPVPLTGTVVHWNLAGWAMHRGEPAVAAGLVDRVRSRPELPLAVTVNEVCSRQYDTLATALAECGYEAAPAWSIPHFGEPGCSSYGNAVFWRGGDGGVQRQVYPDDHQVDGGATREKRTLLRAVSRTMPFAIATTHPSPHRAVAARQVGWAARWLAEYTGPPTILAGDLNLPPWNDALDVLYADHQEADRWPRRLSRPTHRGLRKLDYVFVPRARLRIVGPIGIAFRPRLSDHARITAAVATRPAPDGPASRPRASPG
jgi:hypothetical protein